jgi:hypothetical protein
MGLETNPIKTSDTAKYNREQNNASKLSSNTVIRNAGRNIIYDKNKDLDDIDMIKKRRR